MSSPTNREPVNQASIEVARPDRDRLKELRFFTLGYQLIPAPAFVEKLLDAGIDTVVDVRERAWSRKPGFSKSQLAEALGEVGIAYMHAEFAGNPKEIRKDADHKTCLRRYDAHIEENPWILHQLTRFLLGIPNAFAICFICYERHPADCHRSILFRHWQEALNEELPVEHLAANGAPRFLRDK